MQLKELMTRNPEVIQPNQTLQVAAQRMRDLGVGLMPVCDGDHLKGMLSDRDITVRATAEGLDPTTAPVSQVMSPEVLYSYEDEEDVVGAALMEQHQVRRLMVLDRGHRLTGVVSLGDLATKSSKSRLTGGALEEISEPSRPGR